MNVLVCTIVLVITTLEYVTGDGAGDWGYSSGNFLNASQWQIKYKSCAGYRQSPIDINKPRLKYWSALRPVSVVKLKNITKVEFKRSDLNVYLMFSESWTVSFGGSECYRPIHMHWHWGSVDSRGSEHSIHGSIYPLEAHLVTYNCKLYNSSTDAMNSPSGLHVFGILYKIGETSAGLKRIMEPLGNMTNRETVTIDEIPPRLMLPTDLSEYYRYEGSLTTPPCTENVIWTVFREIQTIDSHHLSIFRSVPYGKPEKGPMVDNYRPVVAVSSVPDYINRIVYASFNQAPHTTHTVSTTVFSLALLVAFVI